MWQRHALPKSNGAAAVFRCTLLRSGETRVGRLSLRCQSSAAPRPHSRALATPWQTTAQTTVQRPTSSLLGCERSFASGSGGGKDAEDASNVAAKDTTVVTGSSSDGAAGQELELVKGQSQPAVVENKADGVFKERIEDILIQAHKRELVERHGQKVERYMPNEDPNSFLLPDNRLEPSERWWQKVFVATPWALFACMLAVPFLLVRGNLPWLQKRAEDDREAAALRNDALGNVARLPEFEVVGFGQMPDVLERPFPTVLLLFDRRTLESKVFLPAFRDIEAAIRAAGLMVSVTALDLGAQPGPPDQFLWEYPRAMAPHIQLVVPRVQDGEAGVVDYDGRWSATGISHAARSLAGPHPPRVSPEELSRIDLRIEQLFDALFEMLFVENAAASGGHLSDRPSLWRRMSGGKAAAAAAAQANQEKAAAKLDEVEQQLDLTGGLDEALASCQRALETLRGTPSSSAA